jgi:hypothetical protein
MIIIIEYEGVDTDRRGIEGKWRVEKTLSYGETS